MPIKARVMQCSKNAWQRLRQQQIQLTNGRTQGRQVLLLRPSVRLPALPSPDLCVCHCSSTRYFCMYFEQPSAVCASGGAAWLARQWRRTGRLQRVSWPTPRQWHWTRAVWGRPFVAFPAAWHAICVLHKITQKVNTLGRVSHKGGE